MLFALLLAGAAPAHGSSGDERPAAEGDCEAPALERLADEFAARMAERSFDHAAGGLLALGLLREGNDAPPEPLLSVVMGLLPQRITAGTGFHTVEEVPAGSRGIERARSLGATAHLELRLSVAGDAVLLTGVLAPAWVNFWTGELAPGEPRLIEADVRMDRATRLLSGATPLPRGGALVLRELANLAGRPIAITVGDLEGDGRGELVVLLEDALVVLGLGPEGAAIELARRDLTGRPRALLPSRDPAGGVAVAQVAQRRVIAYHHTGLAEGEVLRLEEGSLLRPLTGLPEHPITSFGETVVYGRPVPGTNLFAGPLRVVGPTGTRQVDLEAPIFSAAIDPRGELLMVVDHRFGLVDLSPGAKQASLGSWGAALTLAALTEGGTVNRVGTTPSPPGEEDRLVITEDDGEVLELRPVPGAIRALATGDVTGRGRDEVAILSHHGSSARVFLLAEVER